MWTFDEITEMNPPGEGQRRSSLEHLIHIGAFWPDLLCEVAALLEDRGPPYVCCFTQLPYPIILDRSMYTLPGKTQNVKVDLTFRPFTIRFNESCVPHVQELSVQNSQQSEMAIVGTQVVAFIRLWREKNKYYNNYLACVTGSGLLDRVINQPDSKWAATGGWHQRTLKSAKVFENEISKRMLPEVFSALQFFLPNYSIVSHDETPIMRWLYNYFVMTAPGRISFGNMPKPLLPSLCRRFSVPFPKATKRKKLEEALAFGIRNISKFEHQLLAMERLARDGEPELALVGTISAVEWFINSILEERPSRQISLRECLKKAPLKSLNESLKQRLINSAILRNSIVHGTPPAREELIRPRDPDYFPSMQSSVTVVQVEDAIESGLDLYRQINIMKPVVVSKAAKNGAPD